MPHFIEATIALTRRRKPPARLGAIVALAVVVGCASTINAQVDTDAARQARAALRAASRTNSASIVSQQALDALRLADVEYELCAGGRATREPLAAAAANIRDGKNRQFASERFQALGAALERRAEELVWILPDDWPAACRREAASHQPVDRERVLAARKYAGKCLDDLERVLRAAPNGDKGWRAVLAWPQSRTLVATPLDKSPRLDDLQIRWRGAPSAWSGPELIEASLAMQVYIALVRSYAAPESAEQHAAIWNEIARLTESRSVASSDLRQLAELITAREGRGEAPTLTSSIRRELSRPNIVISARARWLEQLLSSRVEDSFPVNDVFGGSRSVGNGFLQAEMQSRFLPSSAVGQLALAMHGTSSARTIARGEGVTVRSSSTTRIDGAKRFLIGANGLSTRPAVVNANTSIVYTGIDAPGLRRRREESTRQAYSRKPRAEADASAMARRSSAERLDQEGAKLTSEFNRTYRKHLDNWRFNPSGQLTDIRLQTAGDTVRWQCCLEGPLFFAAQSEPPAVDQPAEVVVSLAGSAFEAQSVLLFGGRRMSSGEISAQISDMLGESQPAAPSNQDFTATFAARPCEVNFSGGEAAVRLFITAFDSAEVQYPALTVDAQYAVEAQEGGLVLSRLGSVHVLPMATGDGQAPALVGRQQTLRVAVQRKLNRALPEKISWQAPPLSGLDAKSVVLRIERARADEGWLQIILGRG